MKMNRRALLGGLGGLVVGGSVAGLVGSVAQAAEKPKAQSCQLTRFGEAKPFSWTPHKLDLKEVGTVAHAGFHHQGFG
ncbi:MAG: hypothetical protein RRY29_06440 [Desulfovibrionaceae bacterium]